MYLPDTCVYIALYMHCIYVEVGWDVRCFRPQISNEKSGHSNDIYRGCVQGAARKRHGRGERHNTKKTYMVCAV